VAAKGFGGHKFKERIFRKAAIGKIRLEISDKFFSGRFHADSFDEQVGVLEL
jgi:hypothetical protein